ncbi:E3 ubiquitin-protein ligase RNF180 isoform X2 [Danio rerio]|uniref:E3 ubiquitin-protein ligase RNF180 n=1 Tax=Danio rerio TaxID=7955 RepID=A0A8N7UT38_DANRE|nr:E3 ubiquitin-protein ligase RNF180 [Danio rerio]|eukprot:XP_690838.5 E3 ubiquitin-protein ligase RNF180 [Danio rerio]
MFAGLQWCWGESLGCLISDMASHEGEERGRTAEALCLEIRPLQRASLRVRLAHRKAFSLDYTDTHRQADCELWDGHTLRSRTSQQASASLCPPMMLSRRSGVIGRGSGEDQELSRRAHLMSLSSSEEELETDGALAGLNGASSQLTISPTGERRLSKRERRRMRSLRRRQRRRDLCRLENLQGSTGQPSSSSSEDEDEREGFICAVCLDVYFSPYMCHPCSHVFCEPCLRTLAKNCPSNTPCPLCRTTITHVFFQKELNHTARTFFPKEYLSRKQNFQKASCAKWPLPSCRKLFRIFGGFQRQASPIGRRQFPHGSYRLDAFNFEDDSHGWRFDMDMVIIYIYSVNWVIGFIIFCFFCYFFFLSF